MKLSVLSVALLPVLIHAQAIPDCATACLSSAIVAASCTPGDNACACPAKKQAEIGTGATGCLITSCPAEELPAVIAAGSAACSSYFATLSGSASSTDSGSESSESTAAPSTTSAPTTGAGTTTAETTTAASTSGESGDTTASSGASSTEGPAATTSGEEGGAPAPSSTSTGGAAAMATAFGGVAMALLGVVVAL
ncbi:hypothetical protein V495_00331 [Pseudogymnoascus sp. VKM F-4514 (FW-929)]|nr:hypothetical protein V490_08240 [Pseudogymnoascus sp. VKM F-3557]KFY50188.1 hypothetical protein V495_00331 [Pseudogymnoascus sp. VKM F-4514 (FW-929)]KFY66775.1 hypothetical protein V497_00722 [Pseudogymnoascus sp. VKM F-4516 (FW-969)]